MGIADWARGDVKMQEHPVEIEFFDGSTADVSEFVVTVEIKRYVLVQVACPETGEIQAMSNRLQAMV